MEQKEEAVSAVPGFGHMTGTLFPLLDSVVGGDTPERSCERVLMDPMLLCPENTILDSPITICPHKTVNSCRSVISEPDLLTTTDAEILYGFSGRGVIQPATLTAEFPYTFRILCAVSSARGSDIRKHPAAVNRHALDVLLLDIPPLTAV
ncbi:hypothetical protein TNCV_1789521 [Trichonephila clavipes]|nr:hypothetical protein TNCV_1789521 [Trichonephila clavipes]